jgi:hypothetical protein
MKKAIKYIILAFLTTASVSMVVSQEVDDIIAKHLKAHGDIAKWDNIESIKITGRFTAFSEEDDFLAYKTKDGSYYSELAMGKFNVIESFDGENGWTIDPWQDFTFARKLNKSERNVFKQKAEFFTPFYKYKEKGHEVEFIGKQKADGIDVYVLKLIRSNGSTETWYLNAETFLEYKYESNWVDFASGLPSETYFDDFREIDGIVIPFFYERTFWQRDRVLQIENIEFNTSIDESMFMMPRSEQIGELSFLVGEWNVKVDAWSRRGNRWYKVDSTNSTIDYVATNLIQEKIDYIDFFVQSNIINYSFSASSEKYNVAKYNGFSSEIRMFEGNITDTSFVVNSVITDCDTTNTNVTQLNFGHIEKNGFLLEIKRSGDNGITWNPRVRLQYTRKKD